MAQFKRGDKVAVVRGKHAKFGFGIFPHDYGNVMCTVKVEGDNRESRNLWKSSIAAVATDEFDTKNPTKKTSTSADEMVLTKRTDYQERSQSCIIM